MHLPLLKPDHSSATLLWHQGVAINRAGFSHAARQLAAQLPDATYAINLCTSRLNFMLGLAASALRGHITLLPPNQTAAALQHLQQQYPQQHVLEDTTLPSLDWTIADTAPLLVAADQIVITLFTSGSTGAPQAQQKTWRSLSATALADTQRFAPTPLNLVATVPAQHMFGLQTTVLLPWLGGCAIHDSRPFFPADIRAALEAIPAPRALIITPTHLRACLRSNIDLPELEWVLSATAPLPVELAQQAETRWRTQVLEIYGSTEAGTVATRRTTAGEQWRLLPETRMEPLGHGVMFHASHLPQPLLLSDHVALLSDTHFRLLGRATDQIKIAGKRASLAELTHALTNLPGVQDGVMFLPPDTERTAALVVAPELNAAQVLDALAHKVDAVFLPRPLVMLKQLPRNAIGKLTQAALMTALRAHTRVEP